MKSKKKDYKKELDRVFSIYIRMRDRGVCFTCGSVKYWKQQQNGHYVSRSYLATRWDEKNCNCQCIGCNIFKKGNMATYALRMIEKHGTKILKKLDTQKDEIWKLDQDWYETKIAYYNKQIKKLELSL